jgi:hypothetical protein
MRITLSLASLALPLVVFACTGGTGSTGTTSGSSSGGSSSGGSSSGGSSSGGSSSGTAQPPAGSVGQEEAYCEAFASHQQCNGGTASQPCSESGKCIYGRAMSRTAADAYFECYSSPSCKSDDECVAEAGKAVSGAAADTYTDECLAKIESCPGAGVNGELCSPAIFAYPEVTDAVQACLAKACEELDACFGAAVKPISDCK